MVAVPALIAMEHPDIPGQLIGATPAQVPRWEANGWIVSDDPLPSQDEGDASGRHLVFYDVGRIIPGIDPLTGKVYEAQLPAATTGFDEADVWAMLDGSHTGISFSYDVPTKTITATVAGGGVDAETVRDTIAAAFTAGSHTGVTVTPNDAADSFSIAVSVEYLQDQIGALLAAGTHTGVTVTYDDTAGTLSLTASGGSAPADRSIDGVKLVLGAVGRDEVDSDEIPAYNTDGSLDVVDSETGVEPDVGTAASHGFVYDTAAATLGAMYDQWPERGIVVSDEAGDPAGVSMPATGTHIPATTAGVWGTIDASTLGGGGTSVPAEQTIFTYPENARRWAAARGGALVPSGPVAKIVVQGDSTTELIYGAYMTKLRSRFARFNSRNLLSPGWINGDVQTISLHQYQFTLTTGTQGTNEGDANKRDSNYGLAGYAYRLASGSVITLRDYGTPRTVDSKPVFDTAEFHFTKKKAAGAANLEIRIDGTLVQTITTQDAAITPAFESGYTYTWTGTLAPHTISVTGAGGNAAIFDGVYLSSGDKVWVYNAGHTGWKHADLLAANNVGPGQALARMAPALVLNAMGINDYVDGMSTLLTNMDTWITETRANVPDVSLGVVIPYATVSRTDWRTTYVPAIKAAANAESIPYVDMSFALKDPPITGGDPQNLVSGDNVHMDASYGEVYASQLSKFILGDDIDTAALVTAKGLTIWSRTTTQNTVSGTATSLGPNVTDFLGEVYAFFGSWAPTIKGWWRVSVVAEVQSNTSGSRHLFLDKNSGTIIEIAQVGGASGGPTIVSGSVLVYFNGTTDNVLVRFTQDSGSALTVIPRQLGFEFVREA
jgi:hypothetical protein